MSGKRRHGFLCLPGKKGQFALPDRRFMGLLENITVASTGSRSRSKKVLFTRKYVKL
jgi:hypothetical protein